MKRLFVFLLLIGLLLTAGCKPDNQPSGSEPPPPQTSGQVNEPEQNDPPEQSGPSEVTRSVTVEELRQQTAQQCKRFAVAYLGYMPYGDASVGAYLESCPSVVEQLPFLRQIPEANICSTAPYGEVYCIIPAETEAVVRFYLGDPTDGDAPQYDELVYEGSGEDPFLLVCNGSSYPDTLVQIDFSDDTTYRWHPMLDEFYFVLGLWDGEFTPSADGYETLDFSPYDTLLLESYRYMLTEPGTPFTLPSEEDLWDTGWYDIGYDAYGNYYMYRMQIRQNTLTVRWADSEEEEYEYPDAKWHLETKDGVAVLTIDFGEFAGIKSYNLLLDKTSGLLYTAIDATQGPIRNEWERQYRFLMQKAPGAEPDELVGTWERSYSEVEGAWSPSAPGACTIQITGSAVDGLWITYADREFPDWSYEDTALILMPSEDMPFFDYCDWMGVVDNTSFDTTRYITLLEDGSLLVANYWTMDGAPMVSYEWFERTQ